MATFPPTDCINMIMHIHEMETGWYLHLVTWKYWKGTCPWFFSQPSPSTSMILLKERKRDKERMWKERRDHISIHSLLSVIRLQIESLPSFLHLSINTGSIKPSRAHSDPSRQQTFPLFPLTLALLLDWGPGIAHTLKIVIIVLSQWITCRGYRCSVNLSFHSPFMWCIRVHWLIFHLRLNPPPFFQWEESHWWLGFWNVLPSFNTEKKKI